MFYQYIYHIFYCFLGIYLISFNLFATSADKKYRSYAIVVTDDQKLIQRVPELDYTANTVLATQDGYSIEEGYRVVHGMTQDLIEKIEEGKRLWDEAKNEYNMMQYDSAIEKFQKALSIFTENIGFIEDISYIVDILLYLGATYILSGKVKEGKEYFGKVYVIDKEIKPDPNIFPEDVISIFNRTVSGLAKKEKKMEGGLIIETQPENCKVIIDGVEMGFSPIKAESLLEGVHYLRVIKPGYKNYGSVVKVQGKRIEKLEIELSPIAEAQEFNEYKMNLVAASSEKEMIENANNISEILHVERLLIVHIGNVQEETEAEANLADIKFYLYDAQRGKIIGTTSLKGVNLDDPSFNLKLQQGIEEVVQKGRIFDQKGDKEIVKAVQVEREKFEDIGFKEKPFYKTWWFWSIVGGVVVGATVGTTLAIILNKHEAGSGEVIITPSYSDVKSQ